MAKQNFFSKFWAQRRADTAAKLYQKSEYGVWAETLNPLRGLTEQGARDIFDRARQGIFADLAYLYNEIEAADPTLMTVAERREAVVGASDWKIVSNNPERRRSYDDTLATEQRDYLNAAYGNASDSLNEVAEHLERGFFRGFAHARPIYSGQGLEGFDLLEQWNFALDKNSGRWWWNPDASTAFNNNFQEVPDGELVSVVRQRHIDYPGLLIFVRAALGEKKYGIFLERYGIPPVTVIMPPDVDRGEENAYFDAAEKLAGAGYGAMPHGSSVSYATEARGTNPFIEFLDHQQRLIVLMATGGTLTTLASATGIGSGASETQQETWREIVRRDIRAASRAINRVVTPKLLEMEFPGRPQLVSFEFDIDPAPTAAQAFDDAAKARSAGYRVDQAQLEEATGYKLVLDEGAGAQMGTFAGFGAANAVSADARTSQSVAKPLQNAVARCKDADPAVDTPTAANAADGLKTAKSAPVENPVAAALAVLDAGGSVEAALEAYDEAADAALEAGTEQLAQRIADAMEAAVAEVLDEGDAAAQNANPNREKGNQITERSAATK